MSTLQIRIDDELENAIKKQADHYKMPTSSFVKILLVKQFLHTQKSQKISAGNIFNADRDNSGKGIDAEDFLNLL